MCNFEQKFKALVYKLRKEMVNYSIEKFNISSAKML